MKVGESEISKLIFSYSIFNELSIIIGIQYIKYLYIFGLAKYFSLLLRIGGSS